MQKVLYQPIQKLSLQLEDILTGEENGFNSYFRQQDS